MLFDSHTHINNESYTAAERTALIDEIRASKVSYAMDIGFDLPSSIQAVADSEAADFVYCTVGVHPHDADSMTEEIYNKIKELALNHEKVRAIGEIGLDFHYDNSNRDAQRYWFRRQLRLARELKLPVVIHSRDADGETMEILKEEGMFSEERKADFPKILSEDGKTLSDSRVVLHCYSGSKELSLEYIKLGATISICGPVTFKNNKKTQRVAEAVPMDFLLIETDAPYLTPEPFRGRPNKSPYVEFTAKKVAEIKGISFEKVAAKTLENGKRFFGI